MKSTKVFLFIALAMAAFPYWGMQTAYAQINLCGGTIPELNAANTSVGNIYVTSSMYVCLEIRLFSGQRNAGGPTSIYLLDGNNQQVASYTMSRYCDYAGFYETTYFQLAYGSGPYTLLLDGCASDFGGQSAKAVVMGCTSWPASSGCGW